MYRRVLKTHNYLQDSIPLQQMIREECLRTVREDAHTETDDDTPMEVNYNNVSHSAPL